MYIYKKEMTKSMRVLIYMGSSEWRADAYSLSLVLEILLMSVGGNTAVFETLCYFLMRDSLVSRKINGNKQWKWQAICLMLQNKTKQKKFSFFSKCGFWNFICDKEHTYNKKNRFTFTTTAPMQITGTHSVSSIKQSYLSDNIHARPIWRMSLDTLSTKNTVLSLSNFQNTSTLAKRVLNT